MNKIEEFERNLKVAYLNYENNDLKETLKYLDRMLETILKGDKSLENDTFWKTLTCDVFKAIVLNNFYNKIELTGSDLDSLLGNEEELKKNIKEFCHNFRNNELINFISHIENITDNPLKDVIKILMSNINIITSIQGPGGHNLSGGTVSQLTDKDIYTFEQHPWVAYLEIDENTGDSFLKDDAPEEIRRQYNDYLNNKPGQFSDKDINECYKIIYDKVFSQEDYELCINYLNVLYRPIFLFIKKIDKDNVLKEIILIEKENYSEHVDDFRTNLKECQNPTPEKIFNFYCGLSYRLAKMRIKDSKEFILLAEYCEKVFEMILNDKNFQEVCENKKRLISECLVDFNFASGNDNMSFRIHDMYGNPFVDREIIMEKIKYLSETDDKRKKFNNINDFIIHEINIIKDILENNLSSNTSYLPSLRAKHCIKEFELNLESNQLEQCFYNIYEVIESDKNQIYHNLTEKSSGYEYSKLISTEEKNTILNMIERLINKIELNKKTNNDIKNRLCPYCNVPLALLMPSGKTLYCNKCEKYFKNENGNVGDETTSPYTRKDVLY